MGSFINGPGGPQPSVCDAQRPAEFKDSPSHICDVAKMANMTPEMIDGLLLDATAMAYVTDVLEIKDVEFFLIEARKYLKPGVSFTSFVDFLDLQADKAIVLKSVLNRRIYLFRSTQLIGPFDMWMIDQAIQHQANQFGLKLY
jgi:hypothetical protein